MTRGVVSSTIAEATAAPAPHDRRTELRFLVVALLVAAVLRCQAFLQSLMPDESGFVLVGRHWAPAADSLYGPLWVDRPPPLILLVHLSDLLGGAHAPRVTAAALVLVMVVAAYRCGLLLGGRVAARWTAVAAVALTGQPDVTMFSAKSESFGVPLVMASCWFALEALAAAPGRRRSAFALAAGVAGGLALGMKQNLFGAAVFGVVLVVMALRTQRLQRPEAARVSAWGAAGFALPVLAVLAWAAASGVRLHTVWHMLYGFRSDALGVIAAGPGGPTLHRLRDLVVLFVLSGMALVLTWFLLHVRDALRTQPEVAVALVAMIAVDGVGLLLSGSYWGSNLTALYPGTLLAVGVLAAHRQRLPRVGMQLLAGVTAVSTVVFTVTWGAAALRSGQSAATTLGSRVGAAAEPGDTIVVLYGSANIVLASGLETPYEHLWSLPARTLDPDLAQLRHVLAGPDAPTWVVPWLSPNSWGIDSGGRLRAILADRYRTTARVCGRTVLVRKDVQRPAPDSTPCRKPWL